jgi:hypothetical protein
MISNAICANESPMIRYLIICPSTFQNRAKEKKKPSQFVDWQCVLLNTILMLHKIPEFDLYYVAYLKDDPAKEPVATSYSSPAVLAEAAHKTGRAKADFELREITKQEHNRLKALLL